MTKTQDEIWNEINSNMSAEAKTQREESRQDLLDMLIASFSAWEKMNDDDRGAWIEEQKALLNEFFHLRDKIAPRFAGRDNGYKDDGVRSQEELSAVLSELELVVKEINEKVSLEALDAQQAWQWRNENPYEEVRRARNRLRHLSRLPQSDSRIDELLFQYRKWEAKAKAGVPVNDFGMNRLGLIMAALFNPHSIMAEKKKAAEAARVAGKAEGVRDGLRLALWAFDYAPDDMADDTPDSGRPIPLAQLGTGYWRSGNHTP